MTASHFDPYELRHSKQQKLRYLEKKLENFYKNYHVYEFRSSPLGEQCFSNANQLPKGRKEEWLLAAADFPYTRKKALEEYAKIPDAKMFDMMTLYLGADSACAADVRKNIEKRLEKREEENRNKPGHDYMVVLLSMAYFLDIQSQRDEKLKSSSATKVTDLFKLDKLFMNLSEKTKRDQYHDSLKKLIKSNIATDKKDEKIVESKQSARRTLAALASESKDLAFSAHCKMLLAKESQHVEDIADALKSIGFMPTLYFVANKLFEEINNYKNSELGLLWHSILQGLSRFNHDALSDDDVEHVFDTVFLLLRKALQILQLADNAESFAKDYVEPLIKTVSECKYQTSSHAKVAIEFINDIWVFKSELFQRNAFVMSYLAFIYGYSKRLDADQDFVVEKIQKIYTHAQNNLKDKNLIFIINEAYCNVLIDAVKARSKNSINYLSMALNVAKEINDTDLTNAVLQLFLEQLVKNNKLSSIDKRDIESSLIMFYEYVAQSVANKTSVSSQSESKDDSEKNKKVIYVTQSFLCQLMGYLDVNVEAMVCIIKNVLDSPDELLDSHDFLDRINKYLNEVGKPYYFESGINESEDYTRRKIPLLRILIDKLVNEFKEKKLKSELSEHVNHPFGLASILRVVGVSNHDDYIDQWIENHIGKITLLPKHFIALEKARHSVLFEEKKGETEEEKTNRLAAAKKVKQVAECAKGKIVDKINKLCQKSKDLDDKEQKFYPIFYACRDAGLAVVSDLNTKTAETKAESKREEEKPSTPSELRQQSYQAFGQLDQLKAITKKSDHLLALYFAAKATNDYVERAIFYLKILILSCGVEKKEAESQCELLFDHIQLIYQGATAFFALKHDNELVFHIQNVANTVLSGNYHSVIINRLQNGDRADQIVRALILMVAQRDEIRGLIQEQYDSYLSQTDKTQVALIIKELSVIVPKDPDSRASSVSGNPSVLFQLPGSGAAGADGLEQRMLQR